MHYEDARQWWDLVFTAFPDMVIPVGGIAQDLWISVGSGREKENWENISELSHYRIVK